jgi:glutamine synthetase
MKRIAEVLKTEFDSGVMPTVAAQLEQLEAQPGLSSVRAAICDLNGILRGKRMPLLHARKALEGGLRMALSLSAMDVWGNDIEGNPAVYETGDADGLTAWTGRPVLPVSWTPQPTALIPLWFANPDGSPYLVDPRRALSAVVERFAVLGLAPVVATELEFYLVDPATERPVGPRSPLTGRRVDSDAAMDLDELDAFDAFFTDVYAACRAQGIPADTAISENGIGQFEINLLHTADVLKAADDALFFKRAVKGIARRHGFAACFMAKPYGNGAGNGLHVHFSLLDRAGRNVFDDGTDAGSDMMRHAVGGMLSAMAESTLVFAPHFNSYRRLRPNSYAPTALAWGYETRMVAIRIPGGGPQARRIEHRVAGADANPYLVLAAILGAALMGIEQQIDPGAPRKSDADGNDLERLPADWRTAIAAFEQGSRVSDIFSRDLRTAFLACKRQELERFATEVSPFEFRTYLEVA